MSHESRPEFYLPTLPALVRICKVFPPLCDEAVSILLQLGRVSSSHLASISNSTGKGEYLRPRSDLRKNEETFLKLEVKI